jgi:murein DD-endopeptidase MepM/ murein hydrolase activator NlpD
MNTEAKMLLWLAFPLVVMLSPVAILMLLRWRIDAFRKSSLAWPLIALWAVITAVPASFYAEIAIEFAATVYADDGNGDEGESPLPLPPLDGYAEARVDSVPYSDIIIREAIENGIPVNIFFGLIEYESAFHPDAVSYAGAKGLGQLMPLWVNECGIDPFDPVQNLDCAGRVLGETYARYPNDERRAIAAYHAGWPNIDNNGLRPIDEKYYQDVKALSAKYTAPTLLPPVLSLARTPLSGSKCESITSIYTSATLTQGQHGYSYGHAALDYAAGAGVSVLSPINGIVTQFYTDGYGNPTLVIENDCYTVTLLHGNWSVKLNQQLRIGDVVGGEGNNGYTMDMAGNLCNNRPGCGNHTHWNTYDKIAGQNINPILLFGN